MKSKLGSIIIRVDSSHEIGFGHVARCLTLAEEFKNRGYTIIFICQELAGNSIKIIKKNNFKVLSIPDSDVKLDNPDSILQDVMLEEKPKLLIFDHYRISEIYEEKVKNLTKKILVIDDLANRKHSCDILLDQNYSLSSNRYELLLPKSCKQLLGPSYALLRKEFIELRKRGLPSYSSRKSILISFGGTDPTHETEKTLNAVIRSGFRETVHIVCGSGMLEKVKIQDLCKLYPNIVYHEQISNIAELMSESFLAIGAGGITTWERLCLGLFSIVVTVAENQIPSVRDLAQSGYVKWIGQAGQVTEDDYLNAIQESISQNYESISKKGYELVDGNGVQRTVDQIEEILDAKK